MRTALLLLAVLGGAAVPGCAAGSATRDASADTSTQPDTSLPPDAGADTATGGDSAVDTGPVCIAPRLACGGSCVDPTADSMHCGGCDAACDMGESCFDGGCGPATCPSGLDRCSAACVDLESDAANCGACGTTCATDEQCSAGACGSICASGETLCTTDGSMICADLMSDPAHCGACAMPCPSDRECRAGSCQCPMGATDCGGTCVETDVDSAHCGACGNVCPSGTMCVGGSCACPSGLTRCGASCVNTGIDDAHCGACGTACAAPAESCGGGVCTSACGSGTILCGGFCVSRLDSANCGSCGNVCAASRACLDGVCRPNNDDRAAAVVVTLRDSESVVMGSTEGATHDGPSVLCGCTSGANVWYRFTLSESSVVYFDTAGSGFDTSLFVTDAAGTPVPGQSASGFADPGLCNDDAYCAASEFTSLFESRLAGRLGAGTYYVAVGGCATGAFTLRAQRLASSRVSYQYAGRVTGTGTTTATGLIGASASDSTCGGTSSGEDERWFVSCGGAMQFFSTCASDGGSWTRGMASGGYDPVVYLYSAHTGTVTVCNDDGGSMGGTDCRASDAAATGFSSHFGSRLNDVAGSRGLSSVIVDSRSGGSGMSYTLRYTVR